ncbi:DUF202 domain-containing protein [Streptomyces sp. 6N223]|uniref:DUF202 domain-containing protein n=1 Tax=Streptomyces sp. 6N223 TaxID=3457412 RepID=UPI003FD603AD
MTEPGEAGHGMDAARGVEETHDRGAQPERTRLAWRRTTLTFALVVVLAVRELVVTPNDRAGVAFIAVALDALAWVGFLVLAHRRIRALTSGSRPPAAGEATMLWAAGLIVLASALGMVLLAAEA